MTKFAPGEVESTVREHEVLYGFDQPPLREATATDAARLLCAVDAEHLTGLCGPSPCELPYDLRRRACTEPRIVQQVSLDDYWSSSFLGGFWTLLRQYCLPRDDWLLKVDVFSAFLRDIGIESDSMQGSLISMFMVDTAKRDISITNQAERSADERIVALQSVLGDAMGNHTVADVPRGLEPHPGAADLQAQPAGVAGMALLPESRQTAPGHLPCTSFSTCNGPKDATMSTAPSKEGILTRRPDADQGSRAATKNGPPPLGPLGLLPPMTPSSFTALQSCVTPALNDVPQGQRLDETLTRGLATAVSEVRWVYQLPDTVAPNSTPASVRIDVQALNKKLELALRDQVGNAFLYHCYTRFQPYFKGGVLSMSLLRKAMADFPRQREAANRTAASMLRTLLSRPSRVPLSTAAIPKTVASGDGTKRKKRPVEGAARRCARIAGPPAQCGFATEELVGVVLSYFSQPAGTQGAVGPRTTGELPPVVDRPNGEHDSIVSLQQSGESARDGMEGSQSGVVGQLSPPDCISFTAFRAAFFDVEAHKGIWSAFFAKPLLEAAATFFRSPFGRPPAVPLRWTNATVPIPFESTALSDADALLLRIIESTGVDPNAIDESAPTKMKRRNKSAARHRAMASKK